MTYALALLLGSLVLLAAGDAVAHSTQSCLNSAAAKSAVSVAVADCEAKAQATIDAKNAEIARLQTELTAIKTALPCARIVYSPEDLKLAQQQPGPICVLVDTVQTCTPDFCDGYWKGEPAGMKAPVRPPRPKAPPVKSKAAPKAAPR
jgi:hypothetical protein